MGSRLNVGVIGVGSWGSSTYGFPRASPNAGGGVADSGPGGRRIGAAAGAQVYTDYGEMLKRRR